MKRGHLTFLMVPEDEGVVRRLRVSYRALRWGAAAVGILGVVLLLALGTYGSVLSRATRAALLERENRRLTAENAKVDEIVENLERSERTYRQIRSLAGLGDIPTPVAAAVLPVEGPTASEPTRQLPATAAPEEPHEPNRHRSGSAREGPSPRGPGLEPSGWPLQVRGFVTARFEGLDGHTGVDIAVPAETPVLATAAGVVVEAGFDSILGHHVVLAHAGELETAYAHNVRLLVERGQRVARGEAIAHSGSTGRSSAPHLHYEVRRAKRPVDPEPYLR